MNTKIILSRIAACFVLLGASITASAESGYFYVGYLAQTAPYEYKHVYAKKIASVKSTSPGQSARDKVLESYVAFVKKNHPEYFKAHIIGHTDAKSIDFKIRSQATISGPYDSEQKARLAKDGIIKDRSERFAKDSKNGPIEETDDYSFGG